MSRTATDWLAENLAEVNTTTLPNGRGLGQDGMVLLYYFCDRASTKGVFFMQIRTMMDETGISMTGVKRLLAQFQEQGWITPTGKTVAYMGRGKPTPEYVLTLVPEITQKWRTGTQEGTQLGTSTEPKAKASKDVTNFLGLEPEPEPDSEPEPDPGSPKSDDLQAGRQRKEEEVLRLCIGLEIESMSKRNRVVKPGLRKIWEREYSLLIAKAIEQGQGTTHEAMAQYCYDIRSVERTGYTSSDTPAQVPITKRPKEVCGRCENKNTDIEGHEGLTTQYNLIDNSFTPCELCNGTGYHDREPLTEYDHFPADEEPTPIEPPTKRVSTGVIGNTYVPTPPGSADPQSFTQLVKDISQNFTHK